MASKKLDVYAILPDVIGETLPVASLKGRDLTAKWNKVRKLTAKHRSICNILLPSGTQKIRDTLVPVDAGEPKSKKQLWSGITVSGGRDTTIIWDESVQPNSKKYMFFVPGPQRFTLRNIKLRNVNPAGEVLEGLRGIRHRSAWEWNQNAGRQTRFEQILMERFSVGARIGSPGGDDLTCTTWANCKITNCDTSIYAEGPNLAGYVCDNYQIGAIYTDTFEVGVDLRYSPPCYFDGDPKKWQCLDSWGDPRPYDWTDSKAWRKRVIDANKHNGTHPDFDQSTARTIAGGTDLTFRDGLANLPTYDEPAYVFAPNGSGVKVYNLRVEGGDSAVADISGGRLAPDEPIISSGQTRGHSIFSDITTSHGKHPPYAVESVTDESGLTRHAGPAIAIRGGYYKSGDLPPESLKFKHNLVSHEGMIRDSDGVSD